MGPSEEYHVDMREPSLVSGGEQGWVEGCDVYHI